MARIVSIEPGYHRLPLPQALSDSMHGTVSVFEINTVRIRDSDGAEGVGYGYVPGRNGSAIHAILQRDVPDGARPRPVQRFGDLGQRIAEGAHGSLGEHHQLGTCRLCPRGVFSDQPEVGRGVGAGDDLGDC